MSAVTVNESAHTDPRLTACARALRMSRPALLVACMQLWSRVLAQGHARMRVELVAGAIGKRLAAVGAAIVLYELAEVDGDVLDLGPMADLFGGDVDESDASDMARSEQAQRERLEREVMEAIGDATLTRRQVAVAVGRRRSRTLATVRALIESGRLEETEAGVRVPVAVPVPVPVPTGNHESGSGSGSAPAPFSPPTPPSHTPTPENNTHRAGAREGGPVMEHQTAPAKDLYTRLYEYRHEVARRYEAARPFIRDLGALGETSLVQRALWSEALVVAGEDGKRGIRSEQEIRHALDMIGAQADEKAKAGEDATYGLLANAWSPEVLRRALGCPDEKTARQRAVRRSGRAPSRPGVKTAPNEHYVTRGIGECEI